MGRKRPPEPQSSDGTCEVPLSICREREQVTNVAFSASQTVCKVFLRLLIFICGSYTVKELQVLQGIWIHPFPQEELTGEGKHIFVAPVAQPQVQQDLAVTLPYSSGSIPFCSLPFFISFPAPPLHIIFSLQFFYIHEFRGAVTWLRTDLITLKEFNCISNPGKRDNSNFGGVPPTLYFLLMLPTDLRESVASPDSTSPIFYITMATTTLLLTQPMTFSQFSYYLWRASVNSKFQYLSHTLSLACSSDSEFSPVKENQLGMVNNFCTVS